MYSLLCFIPMIKYKELFLSPRVFFKSELSIPYGGWQWPAQVPWFPGRALNSCPQTRKDALTTQLRGPSTRRRLLGLLERNRQRKNLTAKQREYNILNHSQNACRCWVQNTKEGQSLKLDREKCRLRKPHFPFWGPKRFILKRVFSIK